MPIVKTDYTKVPTTRAGSGTFGAKTVKLDKFKDAFERRGVIVPGHVSFPREQFRETLLRAELVNEQGVYTGKDPNTAKLEFKPSENEFILDHTAHLEGYALAARSDEPSAKGTGVFETSFEERRFLLHYMESLLRAQFKPLPNLFKKLIGMPHEIGIMIMPVCGDDFDLDGLRLYGPSVSVAGFTLREKDEVRLRIGFGIGGGVKQRANPARFGRDTRYWCEIPDEIPLLKLDDDLPGPERFYKGVLYDYGFPGQTQVVKSVEALCPLVLGVANEHGTDIYFEAQLVNRTNNTWAITQVEEHAWPRVEIPDGETVLEVAGFDKIIGSGVHTFDTCTYLPSPYHLMTGYGKRSVFDIYREVIAKNPDALVAFKDARIDAGSFEIFETSQVIVNLGDHPTAFGGHVGGVYRETGKVIIDAGENDGFLWQMEGRKFVAWADEANERGGIKLL